MTTYIPPNVHLVLIYQKQKNVDFRAGDNIHRNGNGFIITRK